MSYYVGIDLGTTNSAICTFDGENLRTWKSPEQNDVTPSALYFDKRGRYVGKRAYDLMPQDRTRAAILFKRLMGTSTSININGHEAMTPEQCSAEILKALFAYLPEEIRSQVTGTVITVPAAFNQMQKDATLHAAELAGIGAVALMQEPVAAVMSVMRARPSNGTFIIYDLGGGTLDVAIAEAVGGRVSLQAHGGIEMCGGRDWDRAIVTEVIRPWLSQHFDLPDDAATNRAYSRLFAKLDWAAEKAKIELSARGEAVISLSEVEVGIQDQAGADVYLDIPLSKSELDCLIEQKLQDSIEAVRETMAKANLTPHDIDRIVFVGGPTQYKTVRDKVAFELAISGAMDVNPMTAVAEGAAIFAESIDWTSQHKGRKSTRGSVAGGSALSLNFNYIARTPDARSKVVVRATGTIAPGSEFQVDSLDTGWSSGRQPLRDGASVELTLGKHGDNTFKVFVFDPSGTPITLAKDRITIARTAATVDSIPASHSIGIEALERAGGQTKLTYLVRAGDPLPKKGKLIYHAAETIRAGSRNVLRFKLWEGDIVSPVHDNMFIGVVRVSGSDFEDGVIAQGAELVCDYEVSDSGNVSFEVSVPSVGASFHSGRNFYSRQESQHDYATAAPRIVAEAVDQMARIDDLAGKINDPNLDKARDRLERALSLDPAEATPEQSKEADGEVREAKKLLARAREANLKPMRRLELEGFQNFFESDIRGNAKPNEETQFRNAMRSAAHAIETNDPSFGAYMDELRHRAWDVMWRLDSFVMQRFNWLSRAPHLFVDQHEFTSLVAAGAAAARADDMSALRDVVSTMESKRIRSGGVGDMTDAANIVVA